MKNKTIEKVIIIYYKLLFFLARYMPFSTRQKRIFLTKLINQINEGATVIEALNMMKTSFYSKRLNMITSILYNELKKGKELQEVVNKCRSLFDHFLRNLLNLSFDPSSSLKFLDSLVMYNNALSKNSPFVKEVILPNIVSIITAVGVYWAVFINSQQVLFPSYKLIENNPYVKTPALLTYFVKTITFFHYGVLPVIGIFLLSLPLSKVLKLKVFEYIHSFVFYYTPFIRTVTLFDIRVKVLMVAHKLAMTGVHLQDNLTCLTVMIDNIIMRNQYKKCLTKLNKGYSFKDSFKKTTVFTPEDKDFIFSSNDNIDKIFYDLIQKYEIRGNVIRQVMNGVLKIACMVSSIFWLVIMLAAYVSLYQNFLTKGTGKI